MSDNLTKYELRRRENLSSRGFYHSSRVKIKESKKIDKYQDLARELNKLWNTGGDYDINCSWCTWNSLQRPGKENRGIEDERKN